MGAFRKRKTQKKIRGGMKIPSLSKLFISKGEGTASRANNEEIKVHPDSVSMSQITDTTRVSDKFKQDVQRAYYDLIKSRGYLKIKDNMERKFPGWKFDRTYYLEEYFITLTSRTVSQNYINIDEVDSSFKKQGGIKVSARVKRKRRRQTKKILSSRRKSYTQFTKRNTRRRKRNKNIS